MSPEEIRRARQKLGCTARQLAEALGVDAKLIFAWESGARFPTKRHVGQLKALSERGSLAPKPKAAASPPSGDPLKDPRFWEMVRKLAAHPELRAEVARLADSYDDPAED